MKHYPVLKDENGNSIKCCNTTCNRLARHKHHSQYRCNGGSNDPQNLVHLCEECHRQLHMDLGDFAKWGRVGGQITASKKVSYPNLKQFRGAEGQKRLEQYLSVELAR